MTLQPVSSDVDSLDVNFWAWRPTLALLKRAGVIDELTGIMWEVNAGWPADRDTSVVIADTIETALASMPAEGRLRRDGTVTTTPDDFVFRADDSDYSATRDWFVEFSRFARASNGFAVW